MFVCFNLGFHSTANSLSVIFQIRSLFLSCIVRGLDSVLPYKLLYPNGSRVSSDVSFIAVENEVGLESNEVAD